MFFLSMIMAMMSPPPMQSTGYKIEAYDVYIYCSYDLGGQNYVISDILIENNARGGHARAAFEDYLKQQTGKKYNIAKCVASLTPERAQNGRQRFIQNNNRDGSTARGVPVSGDFRSQPMSVSEMRYRKANPQAPSKSEPASTPVAEKAPPPPPAAKSIVQPGESIEERKANERRAVALYEQQRARQEAEYARVARENARRQAAYKAQIAKQQADYKAMLAAREAQAAKARAEWEARVARCKAGDKKSCGGQATER